MKAALMVMVAGLAVCAQSAAQARADLQGFWGGSARQQAGQMTWDVRVVDDHARLDLRVRNWGPERLRMVCQFYTKLDAAGAGPLYLNAGRSEGACPSDGALSAKRVADAQIELSFPDIGGLSAVTLSENMRPLRPDEIEPLPDSFDIVGLKIGVTKAAAVELLSDQGYAEARVSASYSNTNAWTAELVTFTAGAAPEATDTITLLFSADVTDGEPSARRIVSIHRHVVQDPKQPLQALSLRLAIDKRYGVPSEAQERNGFMQFTYMTDPRGERIVGERPRQQFCLQGTRTQVQLNPPPRGLRSGSALPSHCGAQLLVYADIDPQFGTVRSYSQEISSVDHATTDFWNKLAEDLKEELTSFVEIRENSASSDAIKL